MLSAFLTLLSLIAAPAPQVSDSDSNGAGFVTRTVKVEASEYAYQVYVPKRKGNEKLPVVLFLHGIGQRGAGGFIPAGGASRALVENYIKQVPAIVVLPQCRSGSYWWDTAMTRMTMSALDDAITKFNGDSSRIYLVGVSMGGYGAWHIAAEHSGRFAAVVPICGGSPLQSGARFMRIAERIGRTPVWVFHGADDRIVPVSESRDMVKALKSVGADVRYSEFPGVGHNVWLKVLAERELMPWLFKQQLAQSGD